MKKYRIVKVELNNGMIKYELYGKCCFFFWEHICSYNEIQEARDAVFRMEGFEVKKREVVEYL